MLISLGILSWSDVFRGPLLVPTCNTQKSGLSKARRSQLNRSVSHLKVVWLFGDCFIHHDPAGDLRIWMHHRWQQTDLDPTRLYKVRQLQQLHWHNSAAFQEHHCLGLVPWQLTLVEVWLIFCVEGWKMWLETVNVCLNHFTILYNRVTWKTQLNLARAMALMRLKKPI